MFSVVYILKTTEQLKKGTTLYTFVKLYSCIFLLLFFSWQGDSGGPFVCRLPGKQTWKLYGLSSYGSGCEDGVSGSGAFTRVSNFIWWIHNILDEID